MLYLALIVVVPYLGFVFFGEKINPWSFPREIGKRQRWRRGRRIGFVLFVIGTIYSVLSLDIHQSYLEAALFTSASLTLCLLLALLVSYIEKTVNNFRNYDS